jgi:transcription-repair coupling factor (superfamily II helicase)
MKNLHDILMPVIHDIREGRKSIEVSELWGASKALFLFALEHEERRPLIVVTATEEEAEILAEDLRFFSEQ